MYFYLELRWVMVMFAFRMVMVARVGDQVYSDEQEYFYCNTNTPGCNQVCSGFLILSLVQSERSKNVKVDVPIVLKLAVQEYRILYAL